MNRTPLGLRSDPFQDGDLLWGTPNGQESVKDIRLGLTDPEIFV